MSRRVPSKQMPPQEPSSEDEEEYDEEEEEEVDPAEKIQGLPLEQRRRVYALKALAKSTHDLKRKKAEKMAEIQQAFLEKMQPLFELRRKVIMGEHEPSAEEVSRGEKADASKVEEIPSDDEDDKKEKKPADKKAADKKGVTVVAPEDAKEEEVLAAAAASATGGIPHFWLTAMKNHEMLEGMVMERDAEALKYLDNITSEYVEGNPRKGFVLKFFFRDGNPFFSNKVLTKTYTLDEEDDDDYALENLEGTPIDWTSPANKLTVIIKEKKQRHKSGKGVRIVTREEKAPSFFHFFEPPPMPASDEDEEKEEDDEEEDAADVIETDFEVGRVIHDQLVPRAVHYYTGESIAELARGMFAGGMMGDDDEEEEEDEEEESEDDAPMPAAKRQAGGRGGAPAGGRGGRGGRGGADAPECKQQ